MTKLLIAVFLACASSAHAQARAAANGCTCDATWSYRGVTYTGCTTTEDSPDKAWCYVDGDKDGCAATAGWNNDGHHGDGNGGAATTYAYCKEAHQRRRKHHHHHKACTFTVTVSSDRRANWVTYVSGHKGDTFSFQGANADCDATGCFPLTDPFAPGFCASTCIANGWGWGLNIMRNQKGEAVGHGNCCVEPNAVVATTSTCKEGDDTQLLEDNSKVMSHTEGFVMMLFVSGGLAMGFGYGKWSRGRRVVIDPLPLLA